MKSGLIVLCLALVMAYQNSLAQGMGATTSSAKVFAANAQSESQLSESEKASIRKKIEKLEGQEKKAKAEIEAHKKKLDKIAADFKDCKDNKGWKYCEDAGRSESDLKSLEQKTKKSMDAWNDDLKEASEDLKPLREKMSADEKRHNDEVMNVLRNNKNEIQNEFLSLKVDRANLGRDIDRMAIGQYVAAKMGLMLNSRAFCESTLRCKEPEGQATHKVTPEKLKEIFPGLNDDFNQTDFWQESNKNRSSSAPKAGAAPTPAAAAPAAPKAGAAPTPSTK